MALKTKYDKQSDIPKGAEEHYVERDGAWHLEADFEDVGPLKRAKEHEAKARKAAEDKVKELETTLSEKDTELNGLREGAIPKGDVEALKKSYQAKYDKDIATKDATIATLEGSVNKHVLQTTVDSLATELFDKNAVIGKPHIAARLKIEVENGEHVVKVLGKDGKPSALTVDDLKKEVLQDKTFSGILVGSRASGGGASGGQGGGGAPSDKKFDAATVSPKDLVAHLDQKSA
jgi:hypothetical protein